MSWSAHLQHTATGLAIVFAGPVSRLDMSADVAQHLASLLAVEARHRQGVVAQLAAPVELRAPRADLHPNCCDCDACINGDHDHG
jgi:hypothetical protein